MIVFIIRDIVRYLAKYIGSAVSVAAMIALGRVVFNFYRIWSKKENACQKDWLKIGIVFLADFAAVFYVFMVIVITFFSRIEGSTDVVNLRLFSTFRLDLASQIYIAENIVMFIPLGVFLWWYGVKKLLLGLPLMVGLSTLIEIMQYLSGRGRMEVDDILTNTIGGVVGFIVMKLVFGIKNVINKRSL